MSHPDGSEIDDVLAKLLHAHGTITLRDMEIAQLKRRLAKLRSAMRAAALAGERHTREHLAHVLDADTRAAKRGRLSKAPLR